MSRGSRILALMVVVLFIFSIVGCSTGGVGGGVSGGPGSTVAPGPTPTPGSTVKGHITLNGVSPLKVKVSVAGMEYSVSLDANGDFEILNVPEGQHTVSVQTEDGGLASYLNFILTSDGDINVGDIPLYPCGKISGLVTSQGQPVSGVKIAVYPLLFPDNQAMNAYMPMFLETQTGSDGSYNLDGVPPGSYQLFASKDGFEQCPPKTVEAKEGASETCNFSLAAVSGDKGSIGGKVSYAGPDGSLFPVPGTVVAIYAPSANIQSSEPLFKAVTGWDGTYLISGVTPGSYRVAASSDVFGNDTVNLSISGGSRTSQDFTLQSHGASIHGTVKNSLTSQPIEGAMVQLEPLSSSSSYFMFFAITDQNGEYTLKDVLAGDYNVNAFKWGAYEDASKSVTVTAGAVVTADLQMEPYTQPPIPTFSPFPEPTFSPLPEPTFSPLPEPTFSPLPEPTFSPLPEPTFSPLPEPSSSSFPTFTPPPTPSIGPEPTPGSSDSPFPTPPPFENVTVLVSTDKLVYSVGETVNITLTLQNNSTSAVTLNFPTSQTYDFFAIPIDLIQGGFGFSTLAMKSKVDALWRWSYGRAFTQVLTDLILQPGETRSYAATWNQKDNSGQQVASGTYGLDGILTVNPQIEALYPMFITIGSSLPL